MIAQFVTISHSNRSLDEFFGMLHGTQVGELIDVRRFPPITDQPAYNIDRLPQVLAGLQIGYRHWPSLVAVGQSSRASIKPSMRCSGCRVS